MTTETKPQPVTDEEADGLRRVDKARTQGEWWWATANSIRELKAGPAYDPETVAYAYDSRDDGTPDISIRLVDMEAIVAAVNALPRLLYSLRASRAAERDLREALELADSAMAYMGDQLNDMDAVEPEDEVATEGAFAAVRIALGRPLAGDAEALERHRCARALLSPSRGETKETP